MKKQDFKNVAEIANAIPKMMNLSRIMFEAVICSTLDMYAITHELDRDDVIAGVVSRFIAGEIDEEDDNDEE